LFLFDFLQTPEEITNMHVLRLAILFFEVLNEDDGIDVSLTDLDTECIFELFFEKFLHLLDLILESMAVLLHYDAILQILGTIHIGALFKKYIIFIGIVVVRTIFVLVAIVIAIVVAVVIVIIIASVIIIVVASIIIAAIPFVVISSVFTMLLFGSVEERKGRRLTGLCLTQLALHFLLGFHHILKQIVVCLLLNFGKSVRLLKHPLLFLLGRLFRTLIIIHFFLSILRLTPAWLIPFHDINIINVSIFCIKYL
jgi:hypothetical protein